MQTSKPRAFGYSIKQASHGLASAGRNSELLERSVTGPKTGIGVEETPESELTSNNANTGGFATTKLASILNSTRRWCVFVVQL